MRTVAQIIGENRFIFRKASDFSYTGPKINTRNAEINATNQETERAKSLVAQQAAAAKAAGSNPLMYDGSYTGSAAVNPLDAMAKRSIQELNPTENLDENQGVFNASAIKRLRASGMSDSDIKKRLNGLKPSIRETMSNTGLNTALPDSYLKENNVALPFGGSIVSSQVGANGNPEYILSNGMRVSASAYDQERANADTQARNNAQKKGTVNAPAVNVVSYSDNPDGTTTNYLSDGTTSTVRYSKNPDGSLTPTEVMPPIPSNVPDEYKPFIDYYLQQGGSTERINAARNAAQVAVDGADEIAKQEAASAKIQIKNNEANFAEQERIIEENKLKNEKLLDEQKKIAEEQLALEEARVMYNQQQEKKDTLRKMTNALAVSGGFNSGNGLAYIESTSQKLTDHIDNISKEYGLEKRKLLSNFKASYLQIEQNADNNIEIARQNYLAEAKAINSFTLQSKTNATNSKVAAIKNFSDKVDEILKDRDTKIGKAIDLSIEAIKEERSNKFQMEKQKQEAAFKMFNMAFTESTDPILRSRAIEMMTQSGYNMTGVDVNASSLDQQLKMLDIVKKQMDLNKTSISNFQNTTDKEIMNSAYLAAAKVGGSDEYKQYLISQVADFLQAGDRDGANKRLESMVVSGLDSGLSKEFSARSTMATQAGQLISDLEKIEKDGQIRGIYKKTWNDAKKLAALSQNQDYLNISARMGAMAAAELNAKSGAAISPEEFKRLSTYIPQANDTVLDALGKMRVFKKILEENNSSLINTSLGRISTLPDNNQPVYDNSYIEDIINNVNSSGGGEDLGYKSMGRVTQDYNTPIASRDDGGLYDQATVDAWGKKHAGLDIAMPVGTKLPSLVNGKVIEVQKTPGWGNTVVIEDANGGQHRLSHLSEISVKKGDTISRGQVVALSGNTGNSTGPHLDYRIKLKNAYIDPSIYQYS